MKDHSRSGRVARTNAEAVAFDAKAGNIAGEDNDHAVHRFGFHSEAVRKCSPDPIRSRV